MTFYLVFYICLAVFFAFLLYVFFFTLDDHRPKYTDIVGKNPGLGYRPVAENNATSDILRYNRSDEKTVARIMKDIDDLLIGEINKILSSRDSLNQFQF